MRSTHVLLPETLIEYPDLIVQLIRPDTRVNEKLLCRLPCALVQDVVLHVDAEAFLVTYDVDRELVRLIKSIRFSVPLHQAVNTHLPCKLESPELNVVNEYAASASPELHEERVRDEFVGVQRNSHSMWKAKEVQVVVLRHDERVLWVKLAQDIGALDVRSRELRRGWVEVSPSYCHEDEKSHLYQPT